MIFHMNRDPKLWRQPHQRSTAEEKSREHFPPLNIDSSNTAHSRRYPETQQGAQLQNDYDSSSDTRTIESQDIRNLKRRLDYVLGSLRLIDNEIDLLAMHEKALRQTNIELHAIAGFLYGQITYMQSLLDSCECITAGQSSNRAIAKHHASGDS